MNDFLDIYSMKFFVRMRNKAQMFSSLADDHYHTRLLHSLEVCNIAELIVKKLLTAYPKSKKLKEIDKKRLVTISLLHDIGHTPYGHIGERTLNDLCSGKTKTPFLPDFVKLNCQCGFKHNINSGILYKEYLIKSNKKITYDDCFIIDGITKHSKLYNKKQKKLDYGFEYIKSGLPIDIDFHKSLPMTIEGFIVAFADEIAQMFSDYQDLAYAKFDVSSINTLTPFSISPSIKKYEEIAASALDYMIGLFVLAFNPSSYNYISIKQSRFGKELSLFDKARLKIIKSNETINSHDYIKERNIIILFQHYFNNPSDGLELFDDFKNRVKRNKISKLIKSEVESLKKDNFDEYIKKVIDNASSTHSSKAKKYAMVLRIFIKSVAIYVSKMTDSYADHKVKKIISSKKD